ncbi:MAG: transporter substrate-binding domain-containing protein [Lachnospiraceae bacterium]|nr:transporter substrate-binding domain-containing protein [Lachnospiraceae bacterium]
MRKASENIFRIQYAGYTVLFLLCLLSCTLFSASRARASEASDIVSGPDCDLNSSSAVIAVEVGTTTEEASRAAYPDATYIYVNSASDGLLAVTSGKASAYAMSKSTYESVIEAEAEGITLHSDGIVGEPGEAAVGISPVTELENAQELINAFIAEIQDDGTLAEMDAR